MSFIEEVSEVIKNPANETVAYEIILPSVKSMAKTIASLANTNGGYLIIGISDEHGFKGLSSDFNTNTNSQKAISLLVPSIDVMRESLVLNNKNLFVLKVDKAKEDILVGGKKYIRIGSKVTEDKSYENQKMVSKKEYDKTYAIIISLENYAPRESDQIPSVKYANNDANLFKSMIMNYMGVSEDDITIFVNDKAMKSSLEYDLRQLFHALTEKDRLIFYYVGHGFHNGTTNYLSTYDMHPFNVTQTAISLRDILLDPFSQSKCKSALVFIDACATSIQNENGRNVLSNMDDTDLFQIENNDNLYSATFLSCQAGQSSYSCDELGHGIWTYHLNEAISGKEPSIITNNQFISDRSLVDYLASEVYRYTKENLGYEQSPKAVLDADSEFVLLEV